jgi:glucose-6-phosphate 1-dehydrogenase
VTTPATLLTIFGATGDLAQRMLLPSLYGLEDDDLLPASMRILGTARSGCTTAAVDRCSAQRSHPPLRLAAMQHGRAGNPLFSCRIGVFM